MKKTITLGKDDKLFIKVYHIGYSKQGESCIFLLYTSDKKILYSLAIDCYEEEQCNITDEILKKWKLENRLDMFIWTHAHDDHSIGINKIIEKYCTKDSIICMENVFQIKEQCSELCKENIEHIYNLNYKKRAKNKWKINPLTCFPALLDGRQFNGESDIKNLNVQCISPFPEIGGMQTGRINHNKSCIACIIKIEMKNNDINFLFAGDMEYYTIEKLIMEYEEYRDIIPCVYNYIKIPHHGSANARNMIDFLALEGKKSGFASTSVFVNKKLPDPQILQKYKSVVEEIACTSAIDVPQYGTGVVCLTFDLSLKTVTPVFYGMAEYVHFS